MSIKKTIEQKRAMSKRIGLDIDKENIDKYLDPIKLSGKECYFKADNARFRNGVAADIKRNSKDSAIEAILRAEQNPRRVTELLVKGGFDRNPEFCVLTPELTVELNKFIDKIERLQRNFSGQFNTPTGYCKEDIKRLKELVPVMTDDKYLVIDGNSFMALCESCDYYVRKKVVGIYDDPQVQDLAKRYNSKKINGLCFDIKSLTENCDSDYERDIRCAQLLCYVIKKNISTWEDGAKETYFKILTRVINAIIFHYFSGTTGFDIKSYMQRLYALKNWIFPTDKKYNQTFNERTLFDPIIIQALFDLDEDTKTLTASCIKNVVIRETFEAMIYLFAKQSNSSYVNGIKALGINYSEALRYQMDSSEINSNRDRISKLGKAISKDSEVMRKIKSLKSATITFASEGEIKEFCKGLFKDIEEAYKEYCIKVTIKSLQKTNDNQKLMKNICPTEEDIATYIIENNLNYEAIIKSVLANSTKEGE